MTTIYVGDRVRIVKQWSSFYGMTGTVTQIRPCLMVHIDGDRLPLRIEEPTVALDERAEPHHGGAE